MSTNVRKAEIVGVCLALTAITLLVFWQVRNFGFVSYDDDDYVFKNPNVLAGLTLGGIVWAFTTVHAANWHPLTWLSHMLDSSLFGGAPGPRHMVNLLLHLANVLLLFAVLYAMTGSLWPGAFVAAAFAVHPMHVESVAWIAERKDVLSTFFMLLTLAAYVAYVRHPGPMRYLLTLLLFAFGLMAKPMLVSLPFIIMLLDYWPLDRFGSQNDKAASRSKRQTAVYKLLLEKMPFFILAAISAVITICAQHKGGAMMSADAMPLIDRASNAAVSYTRYIGKLLWPINLAPFYPLDLDSLTLWRVTVCILLLLIITAIVIRFGRNHRYLPVGWLWFIISLLPVIGLIQVGRQSMADRYTYIPAIGLFTMAAWSMKSLVSRWPKFIGVAVVLAVAISAAMSITAYHQTGYWKDSLTLFTRAIDVTRDNDVAYNNRGAACYDLGRWQEAADDCSRAVAINPDYAAAYKNLGFALVYLGRWQEAVEAFRHQVRLKPRYAQAYNNLGFAYGKLERWQEAAEAFKQAVNLDADYAEAHENLALSYKQLGQYADAVAAHKEAVRSDPQYAEAFNNLGVTYNALGRWQDAALAYRQAISIKPDYADACNNLAWLIAVRPYLNVGDANEAISLALRACQLAQRDQSSLAVYMGTLAAAYASAGMYGDAVETAQKALALAEKAGLHQVGDIIRQHLSLYRQGKPQIETDRGSQSDNNRTTQ